MPSSSIHFSIIIKAKPNPYHIFVCSLSLDRGQLDTMHLFTSVGLYQTWSSKLITFVTVALSPPRRCSSSYPPCAGRETGRRPHTTRRPSASTQGPISSVWSSIVSEGEVTRFSTSLPLIKCYCMENMILNWKWNAPNVKVPHGEWQHSQGARPACRCHPS